MAYEYIDREECIGASLYKINNNSVNFDNRLISLNTDTLSLSSQVYRPGSILTSFFHSFGDQTTRSGNLRNYAAVTNGNLNVISTRLNSRFLITINGQGYTASAAGVNIGLNRTISSVATRVLGIDGNTGDSWMGASNGYNGAFSITRSCLDTPNVAAGTTITYSMLLGHWNAGTSYLNYPGYSSQCSIVVYEII